MDLSARFLGFTTYGVQWVLWLLIFLSIISIGMMLERWWFFATYRPSPQGLAQAMRTLLLSGGVTQSSNVSDALEGAVEGAKAGERLQLERNLAFLGTLGSNAPFIGLFGTVLGIIKAFHDLAGNQAGGPAVVMAGISEALVATAVGLMVAIPAVVGFNYFNRRVRASMTQVDWMAHLAFAEVKASYADAAPPPASAGLLSSTAAGSPPRWLTALLWPAAALGVALLVGVGVMIGRGTRHPAPASLAPNPLPTPSSTAQSPKPVPAAPPAAAPPVTPAIVPPPVAMPTTAEPPTPDAATPATTAPATIAATATPATTTPAATPTAATPVVATPEVAAPPAAAVNPAAKQPPKVWKWKKKRPLGAAPAKPEAAPADPPKAEAPVPAAAAVP